MKKINHNFCIFVCVAILIVGGLFSRSMLSGFGHALIDFIKKPSISTFIRDIDNASNDISYKGMLLDLYSLYYRVRNVRVVEKPDETVIRLENDFLSVQRDSLDKAALEELADLFVNLKNVTDSINADFLYVMAPGKRYYNQPAEGANSHEQQEYATYANILEERGIRVLRLAEQMAQQNIAFEDAYFITDHHWLPETGFWATKQILQTLNEDQRFPYDKTIYDLSNYDVKVYEDWFLGSLGKKVGRYFTPLGVDDFSLITPKFDTEFTVTDTQGTRNGSFAETIIDMSKLNKKGYYNTNRYATYGSGNFGLQVIQNKNAGEDAKKIVVIRDSFACCVTPFLALSAEEVHALDVRYWKGTETAQSIPDYIKEVNPDCVIILYSLISKSMAVPFE